MKNIWILNHYAGNMKDDKGGRHYNFAKYLTNRGYNVSIFCANSKHSANKRGRYHDNNKLYNIVSAKEITTPFIYVKARTYIGNGLQRIFNMLDFYFNVQKAAKDYAKKNGKPDVIFASSVHPLTLVAGIKLAKYFGVKCICEVRDLWPEAIVNYSNKITKDSIIAKTLYKGEKWIYTKADALIFTQEGGPDYIRSKGWNKESGGPIDMSKVYYINNGVDLEVFDYNREHYETNDVDLDNDDLYKIVYAGSIRKVNNIELLVDAAKLIKNDKIKFLIWGNGDQLDYLKSRVENENIGNVVFKGRVDKKYIPYILSKANLNLAHWRMTPLLRVGESCNKSFEYMASGKPTFSSVRPNYSLVEKHECGFLTDGFSPKEIARSIEKAAEIGKVKYNELSRNSREAAKVYDFKNLTAELISIIEKIN